MIRPQETLGSSLNISANPNQKKFIPGSRIHRELTYKEQMSKDMHNLPQKKVYKFHMLDQLTLLAYQYDEEQKTIVLLALGTHENFYRDLKHSL